MLRPDIGLLDGSCNIDIIEKDQNGTPSLDPKGFCWFVSPPFIPSQRKAFGFVEASHAAVRSRSHHICPLASRSDLMIELSNLW